MERKRMWAELAVIVLLFALALLTLGRYRLIAIALALGFVYLAIGVQKFGRSRLGFDWENSKQTLWMLELVIFIACVVWIIGLAVGTARHVSYSSDNLLFGKLGYAATAAVQEVVMLSFCFVRLEKLLLSPAKGSKWTARLFCLLHFPNPVLMFVAYWGGRASCGIFSRYRNLYFLIMAHALIGWSMAAFWPPWTMRAGIGFGRLAFSFIRGYL